MTGRASHDQPTIVARYEAAQADARALGFALSVGRKGRPVFVLTEGEAVVRTFSDIANVFDFLSGVQGERARRSDTKQ
jgi:hypothetical protein